MLLLLFLLLLVFTCIFIVYDSLFLYISFIVSAICIEVFEYLIGYLINTTFNRRDEVLIDIYDIAI